MPERFLVKPRNLKASFVLIAMLQQLSWARVTYYWAKPLVLQVVAEGDDAIVHKNIFEIISLNPFEDQ